MVAPYIELISDGLNIVKELPYNIKVIHGNLTQGLVAAKQELASGEYDLVISRGGTATLLRENLSIPVFEIEVSGYDLLRTIYPHIQMKNQIAVIGYTNVINGARSISNILEISPLFYQIDNQTNVKKIINKLEDSGIKIIIGDTVSVNTATENGMEGFLIHSGPESITSAIESAVNFYQHMQNEILINKRLSTIMEHSSQGMLYLSNDNQIEMLNSKVENILKIDRKKLIGNKITDNIIPKALSDCLRKEINNQIISLHEKDYFVEILPINTENIQSATLIFIQSSDHIKDIEGIIRQQLIRRGFIANLTFDSIIAKNTEYINSINKALSYSKTDSTILLLGETGSGKEVFAQSIHNASLRKNGPFVAVNCAALPDNLLESELFGYADGAFTGARKGGKEGLFEMAHKGTIFLDEINDMSSKVQARLLRVLQEKQVMRIGDNRVFNVDIRIIAACNKDLFIETEKGRFRKDLYYRLNILDIEIAPLRKRRDDILPLFNYFIRNFQDKYQLKTLYLPQELLEAIENYSWPGNIRQLRNFAEKVSILNSLEQNRDANFKALMNKLSEKPESINNIQEKNPDIPEKHKTLKEIEKEIIKEVWERNNRNISRTARELEIDRVTLRKKLNT